MAMATLAARPLAVVFIVRSIHRQAAHSRDLKHMLIHDLCEGKGEVTIEDLVSAALDRICYRPGTSYILALGPAGRG
ncbi:hypothetical protein F5Y19DRAFT_433604 [Xylariaceae sp. FL1651]|nr:hypothetical protein F5Y19DRAFT_433604 [Xylariaceae sp. FL1651]